MYAQLWCKYGDSVIALMQFGFGSMASSWLNISTFLQIILQFVFCKSTELMYLLFLGLAQIHLMEFLGMSSKLDVLPRE